MRRVASLVAFAVALAACGGSPPAAVETSPSPKVVATLTISMNDCTLSSVSSRIPEGAVIIDVVNQTGVRAAVDVWPIPNGKTMADFTTFIAKERKLAETGQEGLGSDAFVPGSPNIRAGLSSNATFQGVGFLSRGDYAAVCLRDFKEVAGQPRPSGVAGPISVGG